jgi:hypothetical protein
MPSTFQFFKKEIFILSSFLLLFGYTVSSYSSGPAGTVLSCSRSSCHHFIPDKTSIDIKLVEKWSGLIVNDGFYKPNTEYIIEINGTNKDSLEHFGFQTMLSTGTGTTGGTLNASSPKTNTTLIGANPTIAHNAAIEGVKKGLFKINFEWTAPNPGAGEINFTSILNAVNNDESASGDQPSEIVSTILKEKIDVKIRTNTTIKASSIYPNPCSHMLNIETASATQFMATVYDIAGRQVIAPIQQNSIDVSALTNGLYMLRLNTKEGQQIVSFIKQ